MKVERIIWLAVLLGILAICPMPLTHAAPSDAFHSTALLRPPEIHGEQLFRKAAAGVFSSIIPTYLRSFNTSGAGETYNAAGPTDTSTNAFFQSLGTNGRACVTCHEPRSAWSVSTKSIQQRFYSSHGMDPLFRVVDGATSIPTM
jgi:hypothetical protein